MGEEIQFLKIKNGAIFESPFENMEDTDVSKIEFAKRASAQGGMAVLYAPNGTGKTTLSEVLLREEDTEEIYFEALYKGKKITCSSKEFHVIGDQIKRNIIPGDSSSYLIGANIKREYELKRSIELGMLNTFANLHTLIKTEFGITKAGSFIIENVESALGKRFLREIVPANKKGKNIDHAEFIKFIEEASVLQESEDVNQKKLKFIIDDCKKNELVKKIINISKADIVADKDIAVIEQNDTAITVLRKYKDLCTCVVCDNDDFTGEELLERKKESRESIYERLDHKTKTLLDEIITHESIEHEDPFFIKERLFQLVSTGNDGGFEVLVSELKDYCSHLASKIYNNIVRCLNDTTIIKEYKEYRQLLEVKPEIESEELLFIKEVISENIGPEITIERDGEQGNNLKLMLAGEDFIGVNRDELHLSNGEQNFISLAFELLMARNSEKEFVVMDDPISSFDSVYKNKIAFCIIKFLENKKQIILTHNTDLIRLLEVQQNGCFHLYLMNNVEDGKNGFIRVKNEEKRILINLYNLVKFFQNEDGVLQSIIQDEKKFLLAMIPFMRGYAHISKNGNAIYEQLSGIMHGYVVNEAIEVTSIYEKLFGYKFQNKIRVTIEDILDINCDDAEVLDSDRYPLLANALKQTLIYYYLRMKVEKEIVDIAKIDINLGDSFTLNQIIRKAFAEREDDEKSDKEKKREYRVFFTSRKTLLNEFNHFEGNMNIFQPAIDIEESLLKKELIMIENKLEELKRMGATLYNWRKK